VRPEPDGTGVSEPAEADFPDADVPRPTRLGEAPEPRFDDPLCRPLIELLAGAEVPSFRVDPVLPELVQADSATIPANTLAPTTSRDIRHSPCIDFEPQCID
jgi:hypothetical protein